MVKSEYKVKEIEELKDNKKDKFNKLIRKRRSDGVFEILVLNDEEQDKYDDIIKKEVSLINKVVEDVLSNIDSNTSLKVKCNIILYELEKRNLNPGFAGEAEVKFGLISKDKKEGLMKYAASRRNSKEEEFNRTLLGIKYQYLLNYITVINKNKFHIPDDKIDIMLRVIRNNDLNYQRISKDIKSLDGEELRIAKLNLKRINQRLEMDLLLPFIELKTNNGIYSPFEQALINREYLVYGKNNVRNRINKTKVILSNYCDLEEYNKSSKKVL